MRAQRYQIQDPENGLVWEPGPTGWTTKVNGYRIVHARWSTHPFVISMPQPDAPYYGLVADTLDEARAIAEAHGGEHV